jgi:hypothetical protein
MAALNFPLNPVKGTLYTANNGLTYVFDGIKWVGSSVIALNSETNALINGGYTIQVTSNGGLQLPSYTLPSNTGTVGQVLQWSYISGTNVLVWADVRSQNSPREGSTGSFLISTTGSWVASINSDSTFAIPGPLKMGDGSVQYTAYPGPPTILTNVLKINTATESTSTSSGALVLKGGIGVSGNGWFGGLLNATALNLNSTTASTIVNLSGTSDKITVKVSTATSKNSIISYNNTGSLYADLVIAAANITFAKQNSQSNLTIDNSGNLNISTTTVSVSVNSGALTVVGGVGIGGALWIGTTSYVSGSQIITAATAKFYSIASIRVGTDTAIAINTNTGIATIWSTATLQSITARGNTTNQQINLTNTNQSFNTYSGALTVTGGVGIGGALWIGTTSYINNYEIITIDTLMNYIIGNSDNQVITNGSSGIIISNTSTLQSVTGRGNFTTSSIAVRNTTLSTNTATGALTVFGGVGIGGNLYVSTTSYIANSQIITTATIKNFGVTKITVGTDTAISTSTGIGDIVIWNTSTLQSITNRGSSTNQAILISNTSTTFSSTSGALVIAGGVGVGGNIYVSGAISATNVYINGSPVVTAATQGGVSTVNGVAGAIVISAGTDTVINTTGTNITIWNTSTLQSVTNRGSTTNNSISIINADSSTSSVTQNALYVAGGVGIAKSLLVTGPALFQSDVIFGGTATYILTTNTVYTDNIIELHYTGTWAVNDGKDIGLRFHYYDNTDRNAFLGRDNSTGYLEWLVNSSSDNVSNVTGTNGTFRLGSIILTDNTASTSSTTGALTVTGGVGIVGSLNVGGAITATSVYINGYSINTNSSSLVAGTWTFALSSTGSVTLNGSPFVSGSGTAASGTGTTTTFVISNTTISFGTNSGALQVAGGVGIGGNLYAGNIYTNGARVLPTVTQVFTATVGQTTFTITNGYLVGSSIQVFANGILLSTADYTASNGTSIVLKDARYANDLVTVVSGLSAGTTSSNNLITQYFGQNLGIASTLNFATGTTATLVGGVLTIQASTSSGGTTFTGGTVTNAINITSTVSSTSTNTGALTVTGGVGIGGGLYVGGVITATNVYVNGYAVSTTSGVTFTGGTVTNAINITSAIASTATNTGALTVIGGLGVGGNLYVGNTLTVLSTLASTGSVSQNALYVAGGVGIGSSLYVTGPAVFNNNVTFSGTTTYVLSTNTVYTDNIIELHYTGTWAVNDGKDIGLRFHYYDNTDRNAFLGRDNSTGYLEWLVNSSPDNTNNVTGTNGTFRLGSIILTDNTASNSTATGALTVTGGVGIGGGLYVGGVITATNVYVNGYAVSTSTGGSLSAQYFGASLGTVTTLNFTTGTTATLVGGVLTIQASTSSGGTTFTGGTVPNAVNITSAIISTATNTGALTVIGGVGIGGNINVGGTITGSASAGLTLRTNNISTNTQVAAINITAGAISSVGTTPGGSINITSGAGTGANNVGGSVNITGGESSNSSAGSVNISGGASSSSPGSVNITHGGGYGGFSGSINIGSVMPANMGGDVVLRAGDVTNSSQIELVGANGNMFITGAQITLVNTATTGTINNMSIGATTAATGRFTTATITSTATSTSTITGALVVTGGVGIGGSLNVGGTINAQSVYMHGQLASIVTTNSGLRPTYSTTTEAYSLIDVNLYGQYSITALNSSPYIIAITTSLSQPLDGQRLIIRIRDNGTSRSLSFTTGTGQLRQIGLALPTLTIPSRVLYIGAIYNQSENYWDVLSYQQS